MREIKFRVWHNMDNQFYYLELTGEKYVSEELVIKHDHYTLRTDEEKISDWQQYTGLQDKNGKEIYEGDIVKYGYTGRHEGTAIIEFINGGFGYNGNTWDYWEDEFSHDEMEIIGNIHENPALLISKQYLKK